MSENVNNKEGFFKGFQDTRLFFKTWQNHDNPDFHLLITHGQAEHSGCYHRLLSGINSLKTKAWLWDLRGHGRSDGLRGYVHDFQEYVYDFEIMVEQVLAQTEGKPLILLSHSMGGLIQLKYLVDHSQTHFHSQILSAPYLGLSLPVPAIKKKAAIMMKSLLPKLTLSNGITFDMLSKDESLKKEYDTDTLRHDRISSSAFLGAVETQELVMAKAAKIKMKTLMLIPENDPVVSSEKGRELFELIQSEKKTLLEYTDRRHEIFNDLGREQVFADLIKFISK